MMKTSKKSLAEISAKPYFTTFSCHSRSRSSPQEEHPVISLQHLYRTLRKILKPCDPLVNANSDPFKAFLGRRESLHYERIVTWDDDTRFIGQ